RVSSKKSFKSLEFGRGAPGTINSAHRWVSRFNTFRQAALRQNIKLPFTGQDIVRFLDSIIGKLKPSVNGKPVVSVTVVKAAVSCLAEYGTFTYSKASGYELTRQDAALISTWSHD